MTIQDAQNVILAGCNVVYNGITYLRADALELWYDRKEKRFQMALILMDRNLNSVTRAPADRCTVVPL